MSPSAAHVASQPDNDSGSMSGSDGKKRNKLGYHRTAVACGHCRRRKIRCVPSDDSTETKCQQCIRLKKECQFYPIDQNGSNTRRASSDSRADPINDAPSSSRISTSPQPPSSTSGSFDTSYAIRTASSDTWTDRSSIVTSPPGHMGSLHASDQQDWPRSPVHDHLQHQYSQSDSQAAPTTMFWTQGEGSSGINYQRQQYGMTGTSVAFNQEPQMAYHNVFPEPRHNIGRQSFGDVPNSAVGHSPDQYRHYNMTYPELERSMTMPVGLVNGTSMNGVAQTSPQLAPRYGQFMYDQPFPHPVSNNTQGWLLPTNSQPNSPQHYLSNQQERSYSQYSQYPG